MKIFSLNIKKIITQNKLSSKRKAQAMVEFAIVFPFIIFILGMIVTFGQILVAKLVVNQVSYEGVRVAIVQSSPVIASREAENIAKRSVYSRLVGEEKVSYKFRYGDGINHNWEKGNIATFEVSTKINILFPVIDISPNGNMSLTTSPTFYASNTMMIEYK